jgi:hypothetical protein
VTVYSGYMIVSPGSHYQKCDTVTDCDFRFMNDDYVGDHIDCASLCANFAFTNFTSSTCFKAVHYPLQKSCVLFLWEALTESIASSGVVLSDCAFHVQSVWVVV